MKNETSYEIRLAKNGTDKVVADSVPRSMLTDTLLLMSKKYKVDIQEFEYFKK